MNLKKIFLNSFWFGVIPKISTVLNIILLPIITPYLTPEDYGVWGLISSYVAIVLSIYTLGLHMHLTNSFYEYKTNFSKLWGRILYVLLISSTVSSVFIIIFFLDIIKEFSFPVRLLIAFFCAFPILFNANSLLANHLYTLKSEPKPLVLRNLFSTISGIIVLFISVYIYNLGYLGFVFGAATTAIISFIIFIKPLWIDEKLYPRVERNMIRLKDNIKQSFPLIPHALGFVLISSSSRIILENYDVSLKEIGLFSNGYMIGDYITIITTALVTSIVPLMQKFYRSGDYDLFRKYYYLSQGTAIFAIILFSIWMPELYKILIRNEDLQPAYLIAQKICFANIVLPFYFFASTSAFIEKKAKQLLWLVFLPGLLNIILCYVFVPIYGYEAAIYTTIVAYWSQLMIPFLSSYYRSKIGMWLGSRIKLVFLVILFLISFLFSSFISNLQLEIKVVISFIILTILFLFLKKISKNK